MARNHTIRFMDNNLAIRDSSLITYSSQNSTYTFSNTQSNTRSKYWSPTGQFYVDTSNDALYINDGSNKTVNLTTNSYATPALLATEIQTILNTSSSGWTVTYSSTTSKFTISNSGSVTLRLSQTSNSLWSTIGFMTSSDLVGTSFTADQQRNHTSEYVIWDIGSPRDVTFFGLICPKGETIAISPSATIKLQANNVNDFTSPPLDLTLTRNDYGVFRFLDDQDDYSYRYWKFLIEDKLNSGGSTCYKFSHFYLGDYFTFENRTVAHGYQKHEVDPSESSESESGVLYFDSKTKYNSFDGLNLNILKRDQKDELEAMFKVLGKTNPFYISIDPLNLYTDNLDELTAFVYFKDEPKFIHVMRDFFSTTISLREVI